MHWYDCVGSDQLVIHLQECSEPQLPLQACFIAIPSVMSFFFTFGHHDTSEKQTHFEFHLCRETEREPLRLTNPKLNRTLIILTQQAKVLLKQSLLPSNKPMNIEFATWICRKRTLPKNSKQSVADKQSSYGYIGTLMRKSTALLAQAAGRVVVGNKHAVSKGSRRMRKLRDPITITESAANRIKELMEGQTDVLGVRVGVQTRGCNGLS